MPLLLLAARQPLPSGADWVLRREILGLCTVEGPAAPQVPLEHVRGKHTPTSCRPSPHLS